MRRNRDKRDILFVCSAVNNNQLISKMLVAQTAEEAGGIFEKEFHIQAQEIFGPFYKKKVVAPEQPIQLKFSNKTKKAIYNDWEVNAFLLDEPQNQAYLIFIKRIDDKKMMPPKGTVVVPINQLRII